MPNCGVQAQEFFFSSSSDTQVLETGSASPLLKPHPILYLAGFVELPTPELTRMAIFHSTPLDISARDRHVISPLSQLTFCPNKLRVCYEGRGKGVFHLSEVHVSELSSNSALPYPNSFDAVLLLAKERRITFPVLL